MEGRKAKSRERRNRRTQLLPCRVAAGNGLSPGCVSTRQLARAWYSLFACWALVPSNCRLVRCYVPASTRCVDSTLTTSLRPFSVCLWPLAGRVFVQDEEDRCVQKIPEKDERGCRGMCVMCMRTLGEATPVLIAHTPVLTRGWYFA